MVSLFVQWLYSDAPRTFVQFWGDLLEAFYHYFSIKTLSRTLFDPWRRDSVDMSRLPLAYWGQAIMNNFVSRFIGFILRLVVIVTGYLTLFGTIIIGVLFIVAWYALPLLLLLSMFYGFSLFLGGLSG